MWIMKQCLSVPRGSAFSHWINAVNSRRNCKGVTFVTAWACNRSCQISASAAEICAQTSTCWSGAFPGAKLPREARSIPINNGLWSGSWAKEVSRANRPAKGHCQGGRSALTTTKSCLAAVWNLSTLVQPVRGLNPRRIWRSGQDRSCLGGVGVMAGTWWLCLEPPLQRIISREWAAKNWGLFFFFLTVLSDKFPLVLPWCWGSFCILWWSSLSEVPWGQS